MRFTEHLAHSCLHYIGVLQLKELIHRIVYLKERIIGKQAVAGVAYFSCSQLKSSGLNIVNMLTPLQMDLKSSISTVIVNLVE